MNTNKNCEKLHEILNQKERYHFSEEDLKKIPKQGGIYIMFEKDEKAHNMDRIVRIGITNAREGLYARLRNQHYKGTHDNSTLRRIIGDAILSGLQDEYLRVWNISGKKKQRKQNEKYSREKEQQLEEEIDKYLENNITYTYILESNANICQAYESKLIATIAQCNECKSSPKWLGRNATSEKVKNSSLWNKDKIEKQPFTEEELQVFIQKYKL